MADSIESRQPFISEEITLPHIVRLDGYILGLELLQCHIVIAFFSFRLDQTDQFVLFFLSSFPPNFH